MVKVIDSHSINGKVRLFYSPAVSPLNFTELQSCQLEAVYRPPTYTVSKLQMDRIYSKLVQQKKQPG